MYDIILQWASIFASGKFQVLNIKRAGLTLNRVVLTDRISVNEYTVQLH